MKDGDQRIPEDQAITAAHPTRSSRHYEYGEAVRMVGAKHSKGALIELVSWLLIRARDAEEQLKIVTNLANASERKSKAEIAVDMEALRDRRIEVQDLQDQVEAAAVLVAECQRLTAENERLRVQLSEDHTQKRIADLVADCTRHETEARAARAALRQRRGEVWLDVAIAVRDQIAGQLAEIK